ncbi:hypothetical protein Dimus_025795 [Dionaea muscipula]
MDACEAKEELRKRSAVDTHRRTLIDAGKTDGVVRGRSRAREVSSRYKSPTPAAAMPAASRRSQSPKVGRTLNSSPQLVPKRALSAERKRPSTPPSPIRPSTPVQDTLTDAQLSSKKIVGNKLQESLWPSTRRSLSLSFQSDTILIPVSKKEKATSHSISDRALKSSSNVAHRQGETPAGPRRPTPERKRSPLKGKISSDHSENFRPDLQESQLVDRHRWPSRAKGKVASNLFSRSVDLSDKTSKYSNSSPSTPGKSSLRRLSAEGIPRPLQKSTSNAACQSLMDEIGKMELDMKSIEDGTFLDTSELRRLSSSSSSSSEKAMLPTPIVQSRSLPGSRVPSPIRTSTSRGMARRAELQESQLIVQHRWPSRANGKVASNLFSRSVDLSDNTSKFSNSPPSTPGKSSLRRLSAEGIPRHLQKSTSDAACQSLMDDIGKMELDMKSIEDGTFLDVSELRRLSSSSSSSSEKATLPTPIIQSPSLPGSHVSSPIRTSTSRGMASPSRTRPSSPTPSRGPSPSRIRPSSPTRQPNATSVLGFIADIKKGKKSANQLEDAHQLRLFYNRYLQWRFANARADDAIFIQKVTVEETLMNVWRTTLSLWDSLIMKRINLQQLILDWKLNLVLSKQLAYLGDWALLERDHSASLVGVIKDLEASTLMVPVTGGAKADMESLKAAICSAVDVMQLTGSCISSVLIKVEGINCLVSELAEQAACGKAILDESEYLLASLAALQVQEYSLRTELIQLQQDLRNNGYPIQMV